jgi:hypothetical protein
MTLTRKDIGPEYHYVTIKLDPELTLLYKAISYPNACLAAEKNLHLLALKIEPALTPDNS